MRAQLYLWQLLIFILAGVLKEHQQRVIEYLKAENSILREQLCNKRLRFADTQLLLSGYRKPARTNLLCHLDAVRDAFND